MERALFGLLLVASTVACVACGDHVSSEIREEPLPPPSPTYSPPMGSSSGSTSGYPGRPVEPQPEPAFIRFEPPVVVAGLEGVAGANASLDDGETTIVFEVSDAYGTKLHVAARGSRTEAFATPAPLADFDDVPDAEDVDFHFRSGIFASNRKNGGFDLFVATTAGSEPLTRANSTTADDRHPFVAGVDLYFASNRAIDGDFALYMAPVSTTASPVRLTTLDTPGIEDHPVVTSDGLRIYYCSNRAGKRDIWTATRATKDRDFGDPVVVDDLSHVDDEYPSFVSPDGRRLYFTRRIATTTRLYVAERSRN
jgi:hypothetical protein